MAGIVLIAFNLAPILPLTGFRLGLERLTVLPNALNLLFLGVAASALCYISWTMQFSTWGR